MNKKAKDYNSSLRSMILICSIRAEEAASETLRNMFRIIKPNSKTLGNKSSSLSFKNKIDLLFDLDDLSPDDYNQMVKFMEIRNQFIHNPNCNSFSLLENEAPETAKYLKSKFPNDIEDKEISYVESFKLLYTHTLGKLLILKLEYRKGITDEIIQYAAAQSIKNFITIYQTAFSNWKNSKSKIFIHAWIGIDPEDLHFEFLDFERHLNIALIDEQIRVIEAFEKTEIENNEIFKKRKDSLADLRKEKKALEK